MASSAQLTVIENNWSEHHTPFTTADHICSQMMMVMLADLLGLQQLWSDAKSNRRPY